MERELREMKEEIIFIDQDTLSEEEIIKGDGYNEAEQEEF